MSFPVTYIQTDVPEWETGGNDSSCHQTSLCYSPQKSTTTDFLKQPRVLLYICHNYLFFLEKK